jgi:Ca2+-binding EF-hand superfamily protein
LAAAHAPQSIVGPPPLEAAGTDVQDLLFFGGTRPVFLRLHIRVADKPFRVFWDEYFQGLFAYLDRDQDGTLSREEVKRAPRAQNLLREMQGGHFNALPGGTAPLGELDTSPRDEQVTREELADYYRRFGLQALRVAYQNQGVQRNQMAEVLFLGLDRDRDGKLSQPEAQAAAPSLRKLDADDDELITMPELLPGTFGMVVPPPVSPQAPAPPASSPFLALDPGDAPSRWTEPLFRRYDKDQDQRLSRGEIALESRVFDRLDVSADGKLDAAELAWFLDRPADLTLALRFGQPGGAPTGIELVSAEGQTAAVEKSGNTDLKVTLDGAYLDLRVRGGAAANFQQVRQFYAGQFGAADSDQDGAVEEKDVQPSQFQFLRGVFPLADRDGDGKFTEAELHGYLDLQAKAAASATAITITDHGSGLFDLWDGDRNSRLGPRELRRAWSLLASWDRDGDGCVGRNEIPARFELTLSQGRQVQPVVRPAPAVVAVRTMRQPDQPAPAPTKGPLWFRKMDRNADGDVSRREFLGTAQDFARIDRDGDGLIDLPEAEQADARSRAQPQPDR